jgi:hypothetical protein
MKEENMNKEEMGITARKENKQEGFKERLKELPDGVILVVPFNEEREEPHELRVRKRLNSYGQRAAALMR